MAGQETDLPFRIVECSSALTGFESACVAIANSPGWRTARFPQYPQVLGLEFDDLVHLSYIEVLVDSIQVPRAVTLECAATVDRYTESGFRRLGTVEFDDPAKALLASRKINADGSNEQSLLDKRQLRHVALKLKTRKLRLVFHECFEDPRNPFAQVSVLRVRCVGTGKGHRQSQVAHERSLPTLEYAAHPRAEDYAVHSGTDGGLLLQTTSQLQSAAKSETQEKLESFLQGERSAVDSNSAVDHVLRNLGLPVFSTVPTNEATSNVTGPRRRTRDPTHTMRNVLDDLDGADSMHAAVTQFHRPADPHSPMEAIKRFLSQLEDRLDDCLDQEFYEEASRLKRAMDELKDMQKHLSTLEDEKKQCVVAEDYDRASALKEEMEEVLVGAAKLFAQLRLTDPRRGIVGVAEDAPESPTRTETRQKGRSRSPLNLPPRQSTPPPFPLPDGVVENAVADVDFERAAEDQQEGPPNTPPDRMRKDKREELMKQAAVFSPPLLPADNAITSMVDISMLAALNETDHALSFIASTDNIHAMASVQQPVAPELPTPEPLSSHDYAKAEPLFEVFSKKVMTCLYSKQWMLREFAIRRIEERLDRVRADASAAELKSLIAAYAQILRMGAGDHVSQVFLETMRLLQLVLTRFKDSPSASTRGEARQNLSHVVLVCLEKLGSNNAKLREKSVEAVLSLADHPLFGHELVAKSFFSSTSQWDDRQRRVLIARMGILKTLVDKYGPQAFKDGSGSTFTVQNTMDCVVRGLKNPHSYVRTAALQVYMSVRAIAGTDVDTFIDKMRPTMIRLLRDGANSNMNAQAGATTQAEDVADEIKTDDVVEDGGITTSFISTGTLGGPRAPLSPGALFSYVPVDSATTTTEDTRNNQLRAPGSSVERSSAGARGDVGVDSYAPHMYQPAKSQQELVARQTSLMWSM